MKQVFSGSMSRSWFLGQFFEQAFEIAVNKGGYSTLLGPLVPPERLRELIVTGKVAMDPGRGGR